MEKSDPVLETPKAKKSPWETIVATTPVILTVMATLLAGLSSSEMTQSMYFRSVAAQNQSKVGDQWAFFQAKRIRGTTIEMEISLLPVFARPGRLDPAMLLAASQRLTVSLKQAEQQAEQLAKAAGDEEAADDVQQAVEKYLRAVRAKAAQSEKSTQALAAELKKEDVAAAFAYLGTNKLPEVKDETFEDARIKEAVELIARRKPEQEIAPVVRPLKDAPLEKALAAALGNAARFDEAGDAVGKQLRETDKLVNQQSTLAAEFYQAFLQAEAALHANGPTPDSMRQTLERSEEGVRRAADDLSNLYKAAWNDFTARRYRQEGRYNQRLAELYEVQVHRNGALSDMHRTRSKNFFFGMLGAQAGVAISSFALAARQKSVFWMLATILGIGALLFSGYVYLYMQ